ncbi:MAG: glycine cleavage system aminomethyltransferase GcvT [Spirochaetia bacterium]|nr:glycine cleavage system aminomethyltransferase GcvT [Spirochaetia bacterium]
MMAQTPLHDMFAEMSDVKMIQFGDYELPLHFSKGIIGEHLSVRSAVGLFDVSHMGRCIIQGKGAASHIDYLVTNSVHTLKVGQLMYTLMCYPSGTTVDDLIIYRLSEDTFYLVLNSSNIDKDIDWITVSNPKGFDKKSVECINLTPTTSQFALQGPSSVLVLEKLGVACHDLPFFQFLKAIDIGGIEVMLSRNGYTGEDGFELYVNNEHAKQLWNILINAGEEFLITPCGLGSRDTLRLEAKLPLYGHEISEEITPLEANLGSFVKFEKEDFCGKEALKQQQLKGIPRSLRGIEMIEPSVPRNGCNVYYEGNIIGHVTSGTKSPTLGLFIGYVLIDRHLGLSFHDSVEIEIHNKRKLAKIVKTPFYKRSREG